MKAHCVKLLFYTAILLSETLVPACALYFGASVGYSQIKQTSSMKLVFQNAPINNIQKHYRPQESSKIFSAFMGHSFKKYEKYELALEAGYIKDFMSGHSKTNIAISNITIPVQTTVNQLESYYIAPNITYIPDFGNKSLSFYFKPAFILSCFYTNININGTEKQSPIKHPGLGLFIGAQWHITPKIKGFIEYGHHLYKSIRRTVSLMPGSTSHFTSKLRQQHISTGLSYEL